MDIFFYLFFSFILVTITIVVIFSSFYTDYSVIRRLGAVQFGDEHHIIRISSVIIKKTTKGSRPEKGLFIYGLRAFNNQSQDISWVFPLSIVDVDNTIKALKAKPPMSIHWKFKRLATFNIHQTQEQATLTFYRLGFIKVAFTASLDNTTTSQLAALFEMLKASDVDTYISA